MIDDGWLLSSSGINNDQSVIVAYVGTRRGVSAEEEPTTGFAEEMFFHVIFVFLHARCDPLLSIEQA
ncbi:MAG TPA: hypothetical protein VFL47_15805, partial [Flavisolibacter sp.]|nr:hypothetical protein [Flavisolibacter sp.]